MARAGIEIFVFVPPMSMTMTLAERFLFTKNPMDSSFDLAQTETEGVYTDIFLAEKYFIVGIPHENNNEMFRHFMQRTHEFLLRGK